MTPAQAKEMGSDYIVVGRPITAAKNIVEAYTEDCIYVDDREVNLEAASKVGMSPVLFNSRNVQYEGNAVINFNKLTSMIFKPVNFDVPIASAKGIDKVNKTMRTI